MAYSAAPEAVLRELVPDRAHLGDWGRVVAMKAAGMTDEGTLDHRGHKVWWGRVGESRSDGSAPLLTIHGGPGICHDCLEPLSALSGDRPVLFYDQYGCGRSDRAADPDDYDVELFVDEIAAVRQELALDQVHLYAHSYGGPVLLEYMLRRQPVGVLSLTLSNTFPSTQALARGWDRRLDELPRHHSDALRSGPTGDGDAFAAALQEFMTRFILPGAPPDPLIRSQQHSGAEVYQRMHGSSWFEPDGQWSTWDATTRLAMIDVPTLVIGGTRDQCVPELAEALAAGIPGAEHVVLDTAHLPFFESPDDYLQVIQDFLARADEKR